MFTFNQVEKGNAMNILQKLDRIDPPYSTLLSLIVCILVGLGFRYFRPESGSLGLGIIVGAIFSIIFKKAAECSDKAVWAALTGKTEVKE